MMPWLFTRTDLTTSPAGSCGMSMVYDWPDAEPRIEARPVAPFSATTILLGPDSWTFPVTLPAMPRSAVTAFGPFAGSGLSVTPLTGSRLDTDENGRVACPLMLSTVAPLNEELRCTPVALAVKLNATLLPLAVSLFPLMSMVLTSCAATWVRNGQPSMLTDGLALSPDDWIWLAMSFCAAALATWSPMPRMARSSTITTVSTIGQRLRRLRR